VANKICLKKPGGMRPLGRYRHRWENNNIMHLMEIGWAWTGFM
jgi:hypothetical protein